MLGVGAKRLSVECKGRVWTARQEKRKENRVHYMCLDDKRGFQTICYLRSLIAPRISTMSPTLGVSVVTRHVCGSPAKNVHEKRPTGTASAADFLRSGWGRRTTSRSESGKRQQAWRRQSTTTTPGTDERTIPDVCGP